jgi:hypothetical protein
VQAHTHHRKLVLVMATAPATDPFNYANQVAGLIVSVDPALEHSHLAYAAGSGVQAVVDEGDTPDANARLRLVVLGVSHEPLRVLLEEVARQMIASGEDVAGAIQWLVQQALGNPATAPAAAAPAVPVTPLGNFGAPPPLPGSGVPAQSPAPSAVPSPLTVAAKAKPKTTGNGGRRRNV